MRRVQISASGRALALGLVVVLALPSGILGQTPLATGFWTGWVASGIGQTSFPVCIYDPVSPLPQCFTPPLIFNTVVAKHPTGQVLVASGGLLETWNGGGQVGPAVAIPGIGFATGITLAPGGGVWVLGFAPGATALSRLDAIGPGLQVVFSGFTATQIRSDQNGLLWMAAGGDLYQVDALGGLAGPISPPNPGVIRDFDIGPNERVFALNGDNDLRWLNRWRLDSTLVWSHSVQGAVAFDLDACGRPHVLRDLLGGAQVLDVFDPETGVLLDSLSLGSGVGYSGVCLDSAGQIWATAYNQQAPALACFDASGSLLRSWNLGGIPFEARQGDPCGMHLLSVVAPQADADLDGHSNEVEFGRGTDPVDPSSVPLVLSVLSGAVVSGQSFDLGAILPAEAGLGYSIGASLSTGGIAFDAGCRRVPLEVDATLAWWYSAGNTLATGVSGVVDGSGRAAVTITLPPGLPSGATGIFFALITIDPILGPQTLSNAWELTLP